MLNSEMQPKLIKTEKEPLQILTMSINLKIFLSSFSLRDTLLFYDAKLASHCFYFVGS